MIDPDVIEGKADIFCQWEDRLTIFDTFIIYRFFRDLYQWEQLAAILEGITGTPYTEDEMRKIVTNVSDDTRRFNLREGLTPEDDKLPKRFTREVLPETDKLITDEQMDILLKK